MGKITSKQHSSSSIGYDHFIVLPFATVTLAASQTDTTVQGRIPLLLNTKIVGLAAVVHGSAAGAVSANVVLGSGAITTTIAPAHQGAFISTGTQDAIVTAGQKLFATDQAINMAAEAVTTLYNSAGLDAAFPAGGELTLRLTTDGSASGLLDVFVYAVPVDEFPFNPEQHAGYFVPSATNL